MGADTPAGPGTLTEAQAGVARAAARARPRIAFMFISRQPRRGGVASAGEWRGDPIARVTLRQNETMHRNNGAGVIVSCDICVPN
jgi:hypothetical protein